MSDYKKAQSDLDYVLEQEGHSGAAVEKLLDLGDYIDRQEKRVRELEGALRTKDSCSRHCEGAAYRAAAKQLKRDLENLTEKYNELLKNVEHSR